MQKIVQRQKCKQVSQLLFIFCSLNWMQSYTGIWSIRCLKKNTTNPPFFFLKIVTATHFFFSLPWNVQCTGPGRITLFIFKDSVFFFLRQPMQIMSLQWKIPVLYRDAIWQDFLQGDVYLVPFFFFLSFVLKMPFLSVLFLVKLKTCPLLLDFTVLLDSDTSSRRYSAFFHVLYLYLGIGYWVVLEGYGSLGQPYTKINLMTFLVNSV